MNNAGKVAGIALLCSAGMVMQAAQAQTPSNIRGSGWAKTCQQQNENKVCSVQFRVVANNNQVVTLVSLITVEGKVNRKVFQVAVPSIPPKSLPPGIQIQVDNKQAAKVNYSFCRPQVCVAEVGLTDDIIKVFKAGGALQVASTSIQGQPIIVPVTLKGFTAAFDGPPQEPEETIESSQEKLKKQLEEKVKSGEIKSE